MPKMKIIILAAIAMMGTAGIAYSSFSGKQPVVYYQGHTHDADGTTHGAPAHSGGTNSQVCHNASVPYHCH